MAQMGQRAGLHQGGRALSPRENARLPHSFRMGKALLTWVLIGIVAGSVGACTTGEATDTGTQSPQIADLPLLSPIEELRDQVARTEMAIAESALILENKEKDCLECRSAWVTTASAADMRANAIGGVWDPWADSGLQSGDEDLVEMRPALPQAPEQASELAAYMYHTARSQMEVVAQMPDMNPHDRQALGSVLTGRMISARLLAQEFDIDLGGALKKIPEDVSQSTDDLLASIPEEKGKEEKSTASSSDQRQSTEQGGHGQSLLDTEEEREEQTTPSALTDENGKGSDQEGGMLQEENFQSDDFAQSDDLLLPASLTPDQQALIDFDCLRSTLLVIPTQEMDLKVSRSLADSLAIRTKDLVIDGTEDFRSLRCRPVPATTQNVLSDLIRADLGLFASEAVNQRLAAANYLAQDAALWVRLDPSTAPFITFMALQDPEADENSGAAGTSDTDEISDADITETSKTSDG